MKLITRDTDYAIRAIGYIAKNNGRIVAITELVKELEQPRPFLRKLLQILNKKGILKSFKGKNGGFKLAVKLKDIKLIDIMEIFQGKFKLKECLLRKKICPNKATCLLKSKLDKIEKYVEKELRSTTLDMII